MDSNHLPTDQNMAAEQQQGITEFSRTGNQFINEVPTADQMQFSPPLPQRMTIPSWQGDYIPTPPHNYVPPPQNYAPPPPPPLQNYMHQQRAPGNWPPPPPPTEFQGSQIRPLMQQSSRNVPESSSRVRVMNACYDPDYEVRGLHLDPHLRIFLATSNDVTQDNGGN